MSTQTPEVGFETPVAMLDACHDKVQYFTGLCLRLATHVQIRGANEQAVEAATRILRYFRIAAPLHHQDEELDLFPALLRLGPPVVDSRRIQTLRAHIEILEAEHQVIEKIWREIEPWLDSIAKGQKTVNPQGLERFVSIYDAHIGAPRKTPVFAGLEV